MASIFSKAKSRISNTYKKVDKALGGKLPGGVPTSSTEKNSGSKLVSVAPQSTPSGPRLVDTSTGQVVGSTTSRIPPNVGTPSSSGGGSSGGSASVAPQSTPTGPKLVNTTTRQVVGSANIPTANTPPPTVNQIQKYDPVTDRRVGVLIPQNSSQYQGPVRPTDNATQFRQSGVSTGTNPPTSFPQRVKDTAVEYIHRYQDFQETQNQKYADKQNKTSIHRASANFQEGFEDGIISTALLILQPVQTFREIKSNVQTKGVGGIVSEQIEYAKTNPAGFMGSLASGYVIGAGVGKIASVGARTTNVALTKPKLVVSLEEVNAVQVSSNTYRVSGIARSNLINSEGKLISSSSTTIAGNVVSSSSESAVNSYISGLTATLRTEAQKIGLNKKVQGISVDIAQVQGNAVTTPTKTKGVTKTQSTIKSESLFTTKTNPLQKPKTEITRGVTPPTIAKSASISKQIAKVQTKLGTIAYDTYSGLSRGLPKTNIKYQVPTGFKEIKVESPLNVYSGSSATLTPKEFPSKLKPNSKVKFTDQDIIMTSGKKAVEQEAKLTEDILGRQSATSTTSSTLNKVAKEQGELDLKNLQRQRYEEAIFGKEVSKTSTKSRGSTVTKSAVKTAVKTSIGLALGVSTNTINAQNDRVQQIPKVTQIPRVIQVPRLATPTIPTYKTPQTPRVPVPNYPKYPTDPYIPLRLGGRYNFGGFKKSKLPKSKKTKRQYKYTASLAAAAFQVKPVRVTKKQLEKLNKRTYYGGARPVLELVPEKKKVTAVNFDFDYSI